MNKITLAGTTFIIYDHMKPPTDMKKLYLISQDTNMDYDSYDSAVVCATNPTKARHTHPSGGTWENTRTWVKDPAKVTVEYLGKASPRTPIGVVCASFNAG